MTPKVYWTTLQGNQAPCMPTAAETWLSEAEKQRLDAMRFAKRRSEWLQGRWTAKRLLASCDPVLAGVALHRIHIGNEPGGAPFVEIIGSGRYQASLSLSHSAGLASCAVSKSLGIQLGVDVEKVEPRPAEFASDYFTPTELALAEHCLPQERPLFETLIWSAKEAALKALQVGLRVDTRRVEVIPEFKPGRQGWQKLWIGSSLSGKASWGGYWLAGSGYVLTLALLGATCASLVQVRSLDGQAREVPPHAAEPKQEHARLRKLRSEQDMVDILGGMLREPSFADLEQAVGPC